MHTYKLLSVDLSLFEGAAGGDGGDTGSTSGDVNGTVPGNTRRGKSGETILYGKQSAAPAEEPTTPTAPETTGDTTGDTTVTSNTLEDKNQAFYDLINGEYKDQYTKATQRLISQRFKETKNLESKVQESQPVLDMLLQRYNITDGDMAKLATAVENDTAYWSEAAEQAGMSVDQYKQFQKLQRENARLLKEQETRQSQQAAQQQLQKWYMEAETVKQTYPSFNLEAEVTNQQFMSMLRAGVPVQHAYEVIHMDDIKAGAAKAAAQATEKQIVDNIRAKGSRPAENGASSQSAFTVKDDVTKLSRKDRAEIARRAARGEQITF